MINLIYKNSEFHLKIHIISVSGVIFINVEQTNTQEEK